MFEKIARPQPISSVPVHCRCNAVIFCWNINTSDPIKNVTVYAQTVHAKLWCSTDNLMIDFIPDGHQMASFLTRHMTCSYLVLSKIIKLAAHLYTFLSTTAFATVALIADELATNQTHGRLFGQLVAYRTLASAIEVKDDFIVTRQSHQTCWVPGGIGSQQHL